jgi:hypothetical protein
MQPLFALLFLFFDLISGAFALPMGSAITVHTGTACLDATRRLETQN